MTTITLNLLAEEQTALQRRARDPFKFAVAIGVSLVALAVAAGVLVSYLASQKAAAVSAVDAKLKSMGEGVIAEREVLYQWKKAFAEDIVTLNRGRLLYPLQLAIVKDLVPPDIRLRQLRLTLSVENPAPLPVGAEGGGESPRPGKPTRGKRAERLMLYLDGEAVGSPAELVVDRFMTKLREDPTIGPQLDDVRLRTISRTGGGPDSKDPPKALFVIECLFKERA